MRDRRIIVFGHSHIGALIRAKQDAEFTRRRPLVARMRLLPLIEPRQIENQTDRPRQSNTDEREIDLLERKGVFLQTHNTLLVSVLGGNAYIRLGLLEHPRPFDFVLPEHPELPLRPDAELLPYSAIRLNLQRRVSPILSLFREIRKRTDGAMVHLESPPPLSSNNVVKENLDTQFWPDPSALRIAPALQRWKMWQCQSSVMAEICDDTGIVFLRNPDDVFEESRFLRKEMMGNATHGSALYGKALIRQLLSFARREIFK